MDPNKKAIPPNFNLFSWTYPWKSFTKPGIESIPPIYEIIISPATKKMKHNILIHPTASDAHLFGPTTS